MTHTPDENVRRDAALRERQEVVAYLRRVGLPERAVMIQRGDHLVPVEITQP